MVKPAVFGNGERNATTATGGQHRPSTLVCPVTSLFHPIPDAKWPGPISLKHAGDRLESRVSP